MGKITMHETDKFRAAVADGFSMTCGIPVQSPAPGAEDFRGAGIQHVARLCLQRSGMSLDQLSSPAKIARAALQSVSRSALGTDDLSSILSDVANKSLLKGYNESPRTFLPLVRVVGASDFREQHGVTISEAPDLELVNEHGEYKSGKLLDSDESYAVKTYGKIIYLTRQAIINDDSKALTRLPQILGAAAARKESDIIWALIIGNPTLNEDSTAVFHADHNNLESSDIGPVTPDRLSAGRTAMRQQTGPNGAALDLQPRYLIVPAAQETDGEVVIRSRSLPESQMSSGVYNPWTSLVPISEPRLDADSTKAWYLAADPSQVDVIEMAYLGEADEPYIEQQAAFNRDAVGFKIRHEFGAGIMDYRGFYKNPGE